MTSVVRKAAGRSSDGPGRSERRGPRIGPRAARIAAIYAMLAFLWIFVSDRALNAIVGDPSAIANLGLIKGLVFVVVTAVLLALLVGRAFAELEAGGAAQQAALAAAEHEKVFADSMIDSMPGVVYLYTDQGRFLRWNRNFEAVSGYSGAEIARMTPQDFFAPADRAALTERVAEVFTAGASYFEAPFVAKDGTATPYFFTGRRVSFDGRNCLVGVGIDVSERAHAEAARRATEERYRATLDAMMEGCQIIGFDWRYRYLNAAAATHNRRPNSELLGRTMQEAWPGIEATDVYAMIKRCLEERIALHQETEFRFADGSSGWFDVRCQAIPEGVFILSIDRSERHAAELALQQLNQTLEHRVAERTAELQTALERAESADRLKSAFLATMSHELRTPLNSIIGFTGIVLQELAGPLSPEQAKQLGMVRSSARHLLDLITDVLDLSKIEAGQLSLRAEPLDLRETLEHAAATVKPLADARGLELRTSIAPGVGTIVGDRRRVEQVLLNLLNNGVKFTDHGSVTLAAERDGEVVRIRVTDTGIGIAPDDVSLLFQPFRQVDAGLTRQHDGTGLGLAICRRLVTLMGGEIAVASEWRRGSEFTVTLPAVTGGGQ